MFSWRYTVFSDVFRDICRGLLKDLMGSWAHDICPLWLSGLSWEPSHGWPWHDDSYWNPWWLRGFPHDEAPNFVQNLQVAQAPTKRPMFTPRWMIKILATPQSTNFAMENPDLIDDLAIKSGDVPVRYVSLTEAIRISFAPPEVAASLVWKDLKRTISG